MGFFSAKVPGTIGEKRMADIRRRAQKAQRESMFSRRQVARRKADQRQRGKSIWS
jgi:hypothetical protein